MANTFTSAATGSNTSVTTLYTCPAATTAVVHAVYLSNKDGTNDANISLSVSGSANFQTRRYLLKTVDVPADSTVVVEKPINLEISYASKSAIKVLEQIGGKINILEK